MTAAEAESTLLRMKELDVAKAQGGLFLTELAQLTVVGKQYCIFPPPWVGAAVEGIVVTLHARFVGIVYAGRAGKHKLKKGCHKQPFHAFCPLLR